MEDIIAEINELNSQMVKILACQEKQISLMKMHREKSACIDEDDVNQLGKIMTIDEYAAALRRAYHKAPMGTKMLALNLFGVKYGQEIRKAGISVAEIVRRSGIGQVEQEVNGGVKLSPYVKLRDASEWMA